MTVEQAGNYYLDWICWSNAINDGFYKRIADRSFESLTAKKYRSAADRASRQLRTVAAALEAPPQAWPDNVAAQVEKVSTALLRQVTALNSWTKARTGADVSSAYQNYSNSGGVTAAQVLRLRLGLPAANAKKDGCRARGGDPRASANPTATDS